MEKLISVIVPIYGVEKYLDRCVRSIIEQTYKRLEIILVDDGSLDKCGKICDDWAKKDSRIKVIHKSNGGLSSARNAGLDAATGDYIGFVDSDDYIAPNIYESLIKNIADHGNRTFGNIMYCRVDENGNTTPSAVPHNKDEIISSSHYIKELLMHQGDVSVCTKLFPAMLIKDIRFIEGKCNEDLLFMIKLVEHIDYVVFVGKLGYYYFTRSGSISSGFGKSICDMVDNSMAVYEYVIDSQPQLKNEAKRFVAYQHMTYLLLVPDDRRCDPLYKTAISRIRKMWFSVLVNHYVTIKQKIIITGLIVCPKKMSHIYQKRR